MSHCFAGGTWRGREGKMDDADVVTVTTPRWNRSSSEWERRWFQLSRQCHCRLGLWTSFFDASVASTYSKERRIRFISLITKATWLYSFHEEAQSSLLPLRSETMRQVCDFKGHKSNNNTTPELLWRPIRHSEIIPLFKKSQNAN